MSVVASGGRFAVYDIVRLGEGDIAYPVPWASDESQSFVEDCATYRDALEGAGFEVVERNRLQFALEFFASQARAAESQSGPPALGVHLIIGAEAPVKGVNLRGAFSEGFLGPVEFICELP